MLLNTSVRPGSSTASDRAFPVYGRTRRATPVRWPDIALGGLADLAPGQTGGAYGPIHARIIARTDRLISFEKPALNLRSYIH